MTKKKWGAIVVGLIFGILLIIKVMTATDWGNTYLNPASKLLREGLAPFQNGITTLTKGAGDIVAYFKENKELRQSNEEMSKNIARLQEEIYTLKEKELENQRLLKLLDYKEKRKSNYQLVMAKVIGRDTNNWYKIVVINKGQNDGIQPNMPVINHDGLIGIIINSTANTAEVLLLLDGEVAVGARIFESRLAPGVVVGIDKPNVLKMIHISHDSQIENGQTIITSGLGGIYPRGIRIGTVASVQLEPNGLMKTAIIKPFVDFNRLEEVLVIVQVNEQEEIDAPAETISEEVY